MARSTCPRCGGRFVANQVAGGRLRKYCSRACAFPGPVLATSTCQQCGVLFTRRADQMGPFCSRQCAAESFKRQTISACDHCGREVSRAPHQQSLETYCSVECKHEASRVTFNCFHCGAVVTRAKWEVHDPGKAYCSRKCTAASRKSDPVWREHAQQMQAAHVRTKAPTVPELILYDLLTQLVGESGFERQPRILGRTPDAAILVLRMAFQADGDYWHGTHAPEGNKRADATFNELFISHGWDVVRISESVLKQQPNVARSLLEQRIGGRKAGLEG
jgi:very-short-patch-repair endonuclease/endogenous inhibitor of DNA gyrase (YacG/DUF329 family)